MHRKSMLICVFFILTTLVFLGGCSLPAGDSVSPEVSGTESTGSDLQDVPGVELGEDSASMKIFGSKSDSKTASNDKASSTKRTTVRNCLLPQASGTLTYGDNSISIDASNASEGYVMVKYQGSASKVKLQITVPDSTVYTYTLAIGSYETFPLSEGSGTYKLDVLENAYDDMYALALSQNISVTLNDEFRPFLYPNQYAWFTQDDAAVAFGIEMSDASSSDLDYLERIYLYVIKNITYDEELAANVSSGYLPDVDTTLRTKKGICFDYASLMVALLRSQGIPTKLQIGYSGDAYHAWISVYLKEIGWVDKIIEFNGKSWTLMDPTLAAGNSRSSVQKYIGDGSKYTVKYVY